MIIKARFRPQRNLTGILLLSAFPSCREQGKSTNAAEEVIFYVNSFLGPGGQGFTFSVAVFPSSTVHRLSGWDWCSADPISSHTIAGFSQLHLSGTAIGDLADVPFMAAGEEFNHINISHQNISEGRKLRFNMRKAPNKNWETNNSVRN